MTPSMQRHSSLFSPVSVALSLLVLAILGLALWFGGGTVFNPGPVSAKTLPGVELGNFQSHAEFESQCRFCHSPFQTDQAAQCLECHQDVAAQISQGDSLHGKLDSPRACAACHQEHRGRDFDPSQAALVSFNHARTNFPLTGKHGTLDCKSCHANGNFSEAQPACSTCHAEPASHAGLFGADCAACHSTFDWHPAQFQNQPFDHRKTKFTLALHSLDFAGQPIQCSGCHTSQKMAFAPQPCVKCHGDHDQTFMQKHVQQYGTNCLTCHDGVDRLHGFDHQVVFPLTGKHGGLQCADCHQNNQFRGTPSQCVACHQEPAIHAGFFGTRCDYCHSLQGWRPAPLHAHAFPLDHGGKGEVTCQTCHPAKYAAYRCDTCHEHAPDLMVKAHARLNLTSDQLSDCVHCHLDGKAKP